MQQLRWRCRCRATCPNRRSTQARFGSASSHRAEAISPSFDRRPDLDLERSSRMQVDHARSLPVRSTSHYACAIVVDSRRPSAPATRRRAASSARAIAASPHAPLELKSPAASAPRPRTPSAAAAAPPREAVDDQRHRRLLVEPALHRVEQLVVADLRWSSPHARSAPTGCAPRYTARYARRIGRRAAG